MDITYQIPRAALRWVLASVVLVLLPQTLRMPIWVSVIALTCIIWRILIHAGKLNYPGRQLRVVIVVFTLFVSASQIRALGGVALIQRRVCWRWDSCSNSSRCATSATSTSSSPCVS
ncbi:MAG: DUF3488 domain-containing protein [Gammaproteobacteria bacterium]|nr:DUF3488 domain-containing protein [Gammaproteobacteria bacterium]